MTWILLVASMQLSYFPGAEYRDTRQHPSVIVHNVFEVSLEAEARLLNYGSFHLFVGGGMAVPVVPDSITAWFASSLISTFRAGFRLGPMEAGYQHRCGHPVVAWGNYPADDWNRYQDQIYLKVSSGL